MNTRYERRSFSLFDIRADRIEPDAFASVNHRKFAGHSENSSLDKIAIDMSSQHVKEKLAASRIGPLGRGIECTFDEVSSHMIHKQISNHSSGAH